ncbi:hypothetical protein GGR56DRAFT_22524 [Xylariaceae sp. FL0804]|nr:hypothetical protein GGR56DRAFT_22524 [Xylariaceae sp. FL0804]
MVIFRDERMKAGPLRARSGNAMTGFCFAIAGRRKEGRQDRTREEKKKHLVARWKHGERLSMTESCVLIYFFSVPTCHTTPLARTGATAVGSFTCGDNQGKHSRTMKYFSAVFFSCCLVACACSMPKCSTYLEIRGTGCPYGAAMAAVKAVTN